MDRCFNLWGYKGLPPRVCKKRGCLEALYRLLRSHVVAATCTCRFKKLCLARARARALKDDPVGVDAAGSTSATRALLVSWFLICEPCRRSDYLVLRGNGGKTTSRSSKIHLIPVGTLRLMNWFKVVVRHREIKRLHANSARAFNSNASEMHFPIRVYFNLQLTLVSIIQSS